MRTKKFGRGGNDMMKPFTQEKLSLLALGGPGLVRGK